MTDGYGDYVRHYIRAMAARPELAPSYENHLLGSSSVIVSIIYSPDSILYKTFDGKSNEILRLTTKPSSLKIENKVIAEQDDPGQNGWNWIPMGSGGILRVLKEQGNHVIIVF